LVYATDAGHAMIDRDLYVPQGWTCDLARCRAAGIPDQVGFATKPALARAMLARALDAGVPAAWVTGDEVYGACPGCGPGLRPAASATCWRSPVTTRSGPAAPPSAPTPCSGVSQRGPGSASRPAGAPKVTATTRLGVPPPGQRRAGSPAWLLARRHQRTGELAFYHCFMPHPVPLATLVRVAGQRWRIEERFQTGKGLVGLDQHQVRRWRSWYRWVTLAMLAHAFLVVAALIDQARNPAPSGLVRLTCNEVQHLFAALVAQPAGDVGHRLRWSLWRRRHQARARTCHYRRQAAQVQ
jgi:DDE superfamily endonuclease